MHRLEITCAVDGADVRQCKYAAAFLVPGIVDVQVEGDRWRFTLERDTDASTLEYRLKLLVARFTVAPPQVASIFELTAPGSLPGLPAQLAGIDRIYSGLDVWSGDLARFLRFLDQAIVRRFAEAFRPREETYPNVIPVRDLWQANHLSSFPEHLHFVAHLESDVEQLDAFAARARAGELRAVGADDDRLAPAGLVHNPSTCYHCYALRAGKDISSDGAVTAITRCHRYEGVNHREPGRLLEFSMREIIFLGSPDYVRATRTRSLDIVEQMASSWHLYGALVTANDPFFSSDYANKATHQHRMAMKYEYRALLPPHGEISVLSSNLHGPTFSKAFSITSGGRPINTGCIGFGLERLALALIAQHGVSSAGWPEALRDEYEAFRAADPLTS